MSLAIASDLGSYGTRLRLPPVEFFVLTFADTLTYIPLRVKMTMHDILVQMANFPWSLCEAAVLGGLTVKSLLKPCFVG